VFVLFCFDDIDDLLAVHHSARFGIVSVQI